jgi:hypothetical protein
MSAARVTLTVVALAEGEDDDVAEREGDDDTDGDVDGDGAVDGELPEEPLPADADDALIS